MARPPPIQLTGLIEASRLICLAILIIKRNMKASAGSCATVPFFTLQEEHQPLLTSDVVNTHQLLKSNTISTTKDIKIAMNSKPTLHSLIPFRSRFKLLTEMDNLTQSLSRHSISCGKLQKLTKALNIKVAKRVPLSNFSDGHMLILNRSAHLWPKQAGWVSKSSLLRNQYSHTNGLRMVSLILGGSITNLSAISSMEDTALERNSEI